MGAVRRFSRGELGLNSVNCPVKHINTTFDFCFLLSFLRSQTVDKLREHLNRLLPRMGKKKVDSLVVNYVAKLVGSSLSKSHFNLQLVFI